MLAAFRRCRLRPFEAERGVGTDNALDCVRVAPVRATWALAHVFPWLALGEASIGYAEGAGLDEARLKGERSLGWESRRGP